MALYRVWPDIESGRSPLPVLSHFRPDIEFGQISEPYKWPDIGFDLISGGQISGPKCIFVLLVLIYNHRHGKSK